MYNDWQNQINVELRALRREETREQMRVEDQLLRAGRLEQQAVSVQPLPGARVRRSWLTLSRALLHWWRTRREPLGAVHLAVADSTGRGTGAE